jgi:anti-anti-sigma regulatory factor
MLLKTTNLRKNIVFIKPNAFINKDIKEILEEIKFFISSKECKQNVILDLTETGFLSSIKIGVLVATSHFLKFIDGKIYIVVQDKQAKKFIELLDLNNAVVIYSQSQLSLDNIA